MTQDELADHLGVCRQLISAQENQHEATKIMNLPQLAEQPDALYLQLIAMVNEYRAAQGYSACKLVLVTADERASERETQETVRHLRAQIEKLVEKFCEGDR